MNIAVIMAAGSGERLTKFLGIKKQYSLLYGDKEMFLYPIFKFLDYGFKRIVLVCPPNEKSKMQEILKDNNLSYIEIIEGDATRQESVFNAMKYLFNNVSDEDFIYIHDGDRPLLSTSLLRRIESESNRHEVIIPALKVFDSLYDYDKKEYVDRSKYRMIQTPQVSKYKLLKEAFRLNQDHLEDFKDEGSIIRTIYDDIHFIDGDIYNIKVTDEETYSLANLYLKENRHAR